jgi:hypothetical protein
MEAVDDHSILMRTGPSGNLVLILKLTLEVFDQLSQAFSREGVTGLQCQSTGLLQPSVQFCALSAIHFYAHAI